MLPKVFYVLPYRDCTCASRLRILFEKLLEDLLATITYFKTKILKR
jgi:hypothetical protein